MAHTCTHLHPRSSRKVSNTMSHTLKKLLKGKQGHLSKTVSTHSVNIYELHLLECHFNSVNLINFGTF